MPNYFDLDGNAITMEQWAALFESRVTVASETNDFTAWKIADTEIGSVSVSTIWLGLNHNFYDDGPPLIFETMIFGFDDLEPMWRYSTYAEAEHGHEQAVDEAKWLIFLRELRSRNCDRLPELSDC